MGSIWSIPPSVLSRLEDAFDHLRRGANYGPIIVDGYKSSWYISVLEGVLTVRNAALKKWPEHDKSPTKKEENSR